MFGRISSGPEPMKSILLLACAVALATTAHAGDLPSPIAQAAKGQLQCYEPNAANKSCRSLAAYRIGADGKIANTAWVLIAPKPALIVMETVTPVEIKNDRVCGKMGPQDIAAAKFTAGGKPLEGAPADTLRQHMATALKPMFDHEICTAYIAEGDGFIAKATDNGAPISATQRVIWVSSGDGYEVGS